MNNLFFTNKPIVGLDISNTDIKIMSINQNTQSITGYGAIDLDPTRAKQSLDGQDTYILKSLQSLLQDKIVGQLLSNRVALGIPTSRTFSHTFTIPTSAESNINEA